MSDTVESIKKLRATLREKLDKIPEFREYEVLGKTVAELEALNNASKALSAAPGSVTAGGEIERFVERTTGTLRDLIVQTARAQLPSNADLCVNRIMRSGVPQTTGELTSFLEGQGRPAKSLVSTLSRDDRLINIPWGSNKAWWLNGAVLPQEPDGLPGLGGTTEGDASAAEIEELLK